MATERIRYYRTDSTAGGDGTTDTTTGSTRAYESCKAAVAGEIASAPDLVTDGVWLHLICTTAGTDTAVPVDITGFTDAATNYILIECQGGAKFKGVSVDNDGTGYKFEVTSTNAFRIRDDFVRLKGMELQSTTNLLLTTLGTAAATTDIRVEQCGFLYDGAGTSGYFVTPGNTNQHTVKFENCMFIGNVWPSDTRTWKAVTFDHCVAYGSSARGFVSDTEATYTNCISAGYSSWCYWTGGNPAGSHNAASDTTAVSQFTSSIDSITVANEFTSPSETLSSFDFTLKDSLLNAVGTGSLATDIADTTRTGTADLGVFEWAAAGGGSVQITNMVGSGWGMSHNGGGMAG